MDILFKNDAAIIGGHAAVMETSTETRIIFPHLPRRTVDFPTQIC